MPTGRGVRIGDRTFGVIVSMFWCVLLVAVVVGIVWLFT